MAKRKSSVFIPIAVVLAAVTTGLALSAPAWREFQQEDRKARARTLDAKTQERALADALRGESLSQTAVGRESMLRGRGMLKKGEVALSPAQSNP